MIDALQASLARRRLRPRGPIGAAAGRSPKTSPTRSRPARRRAPIPIGARPSPSRTSSTRRRASNLVQVKDIGDRPRPTSRSSRIPAIRRPTARHRQDAERQHDHRNERHARSQPLLRGRPAGHQAVARPDLHDHRPSEGLLMIAALPLITSALSLLAPAARRPPSRQAAATIGRHGGAATSRRSWRRSRPTRAKPSRRPSSCRSTASRARPTCSPCPGRDVGAGESCRPRSPIRDKAVARLPGNHRMAIGESDASRPE